MQILVPQSGPVDNSALPLSDPPSAKPRRADPRPTAAQVQELLCEFPALSMAPGMAAAMAQWEEALRKAPVKDKRWASLPALRRHLALLASHPPALAVEAVCLAADNRWIDPKHALAALLGNRAARPPDRPAARKPSEYPEPKRTLDEL